MQATSQTKMGTGFAFSLQVSAYFTHSLARGLVLPWLPPRAGWRWLLAGFQTNVSGDKARLVFLRTFQQPKFRFPTRLIKHLSPSTHLPPVLLIHGSTSATFHVDLERVDCWVIARLVPSQQHPGLACLQGWGPAGFWVAKGQ